MKLVDLDLRETCDDDLGPRFPIFSDPEAFIRSAQLRPFEDIYRAADLHYRAHWACRNAQLMRSPETLNTSVVMERR